MRKYPNVLTSDDVREIIRGSPNAPAAPAAPAALPVSELQSFLKGYHRITVSEACQRIADNNLDVWIKPWNDWQHVDKVQVNEAVVQARKKGTSFCNAFLKDKLRLTDARYDDIKARFNDAHFGDPTGVYAANQGDGVAVVISMKF